MSILVSLLKDLVFARKRATRAAVQLSGQQRPPSALAATTPLPEQHQQASDHSYFREQEKKMASGIAYLEGVVQSDPGNVNALFSLGLLYQTAQRVDDAIACFRETVALKPEHYGAMSALQHLLQNACAWEDLASRGEILRRGVVTTPTTDMATFIEPFSFLAIPGTTAAEQRRCAERYAKIILHNPDIEAARKRLGFSFTDRKDARIRIGYLSYDFFSHATARLMARTFELHDRGRFHITAYSYGGDDASPMRRRLEDAFDEFVDIVEASDEEAAKRIHADAIDILVDLKGYTQYSRSGIVALKPAPIQVNYLGYPGTMGSSLIDYIIADAFIIPPDLVKHYAEKVICLPDCYQPTDDSRARPVAPSRRECGLPEQGFVFCCFNQTYKITPEIFAIWCRLLQSVPGSYLWLWASNAEAESHLKAEAARYGIHPERLIMAPSIWDAEKHLARLQCADLFLDTLPYNAHTTCSDALWMGLPVVTCTGETFPSRVAGSLLTALGMPELITASLDDYYRLALELATDRQKLESARNKIAANRSRAPLFDSARFTRNLEQAYLQMMAAWRATGGA